MNLIHWSIISGLLINTILCYCVFRANPKRVENRGFLVLSVVVTIWLVCLLMAFTSTGDEEVEFWIRQCCAAGQCLATAFTILRLSIVYKQESWWRIVWRSKRWLLANVFIAILCQTPFFLKAAIFSGFGNVANPIYGPGFLIYNIYFMLSFIVLLYNLIGDIRRSRGIQRAELQFVLLGVSTFFLIVVFFSVIWPMLTKNSGLVQFIPLWVIVLNAIIAYGIATRRIMGVSYILRSTVAYGLLTLYLTLLYAGIWMVLSHVLPKSFSGTLLLSHLFASLAVAFSMAPAQGQMQRMARHLYLTTPPIDGAAIIRQATQMMHSITTLPELLKRFSGMVSELVGTDRVVIFLLENDAYVQKHTGAFMELPLLHLSQDNPLVVRLKKVHEPIVTDELERLRPTTELLSLTRQMTESEAAVVIGIHSRNLDLLNGLIVLGPRVSGRIYGVLEQETLQALCNQLSIAIENAQLYTGAQDSKIYNEILLDNLVNGVVAANTHGVVTVFNREAQRMTGLNSAQTLDHSIDLLPSSIAALFQQTLKTGQSFSDIESVLFLNGKGDHEGIPVRMGSSLFKGHDGDVLGALIVFRDMTTVKKLEMQMRRTDRLASVGTLSAGMAHEIKNPLVAIKTFTQLLPERYQDKEFRNSFFSLVGHEVDRIDTIVNHLLGFARPKKPVLAPTDLIQVINRSLHLIELQLEQKKIKLDWDFPESSIMIMADPNQIEQALLNLQLNAIEAMEEGGKLEVSTAIIETFFPRLDTKQQLDSLERSVLITIKDSGYGIRPENMAHIFDPFFTTKRKGTGMGLAVLHQIIQEHKGSIDVESEPEVGTSFRISLPLMKEEGVVA